MAATTEGTATWGVAGTAGLTASVITDFSVSRQGMFGAENNENGAVIKQTLYDEQVTVTLTAMVAAATDPPKAGDALTVAGMGTKSNGTYYVTGSEVIESNKDYRKIRITAECYTNCTAITAATT